MAIAKRKGVRGLGREEWENEKHREDTVVLADGWRRNTYLNRVSFASERSHPGIMMRNPFAINNGDLDELGRTEGDTHTEIHTYTDTW